MDILTGPLSGPAALDVAGLPRSCDCPSGLRPGVLHRDGHKIEVREGLPFSGF